MIRPALLFFALALVGCASQTHAVAPSTVGVSVQHIVTEELDRAVAEWQPAAAVVVVLDVSTGAVVVMEGRDHGQNVPLLASTRTYVTGSTLKTLTIAGALDAHTIALDAQVDCATRSYGADKLTDGDEHGVLSITDVLAVSSNVGASRIYDTLGRDRFMTLLKRFHVGDPPASLPTLTEGSVQSGMLGAGELAKATPLQMALAYAAIFNDGVYVAPDHPAERVLQSATAKTMVDMLEAIVASDRGTSRSARTAGLRVAGKTGTAAGDFVYASFVGTVLGQSSRYVVLVGLEAPREGGFGPTAAAPVFSRIARRLYQDRVEP